MKKRKRTSPFLTSPPGVYADEFRNAGYIVERSTEAIVTTFPAVTPVIARNQCNSYV
ncbi:MAG: hypothetical protein JWQ49_1950 [Edaphobacter sp.]|nr:hypothetical protein [Edaphobacter sp.]